MIEGMISMAPSLYGPEPGVDTRGRYGQALDHRKIMLDIL